MEMIIILHFDDAFKCEHSLMNFDKSYKFNIRIISLISSKSIKVSLC
jgi:hypothetical protein